MSRSPILSLLPRPERVPPHRRPLCVPIQLILSRSRPCTPNERLARLLRCDRDARYSQHDIAERFKGHRDGVVLRPAAEEEVKRNREARSESGTLQSSLVDRLGVGSLVVFLETGGLICQRGMPGQIRKCAVDLPFGLLQSGQAFWSVIDIYLMWL